MLESIIACFPPESEYFTHRQELDLLIQMISQPLYCFHSETIPFMSTLENSWGPLDSGQAVAQLERTLMHSVIPRLGVLKRQVHKYMEGINTMLLLHVTDLLRSNPFRGISEEQAAELEDIRQRAKVAGLQDLDPLATMTIDRQQKCFLSIGRAAHHHWEEIELSLNELWSRAAVRSGDESSTSKKTASKALTRTSGEDNFEANHIDNRRFPMRSFDQSPFQGFLGQEPNSGMVKSENSMLNIRSTGDNLRLQSRSPDVAYPGPGIRRKPLGTSRYEPPPQSYTTTGTQHASPHKPLPGPQPHNTAQYGNQRQADTRDNARPKHTVPRMELNSTDSGVVNNQSTPRRRTGFSRFFTSSHPGNPVGN
ncbi:hypothetical protein N7454_011057 [Penicillium verhagenii]|nr:hypothetical protein N7454_011057 [Penicillium verhagenii]